MAATPARRLALKAAEEAALHAGTAKGTDAASTALSLAMLELAHQVRRLGEQMPMFGPPEER